MPATQTTETLDRRELLKALKAVKRGDFSTRLDDELSGIDGEIAATFNEILERQQGFSEDLTRLAEDVGKRGRLKERILIGGGRGAWATQVRAVNQLVDDLGSHSGEMAKVIAAVGRGDLTQRMEIEEDAGTAVQGDFFAHARTVNRMVDALGRFGVEVTRVAREVGVEGTLGAQAEVEGVSGTWKELTDSVNQMAMNLTNQVRDIARVTTAVASGDLTQKITVDVRGEVLQLKETINTMVDQLSAFSSEVTRVAREVGTEGILGGQAEVTGVSGTWKELTYNVNSMANNLTSQVRNIAEVTTAVANGDLSRQITVEARGEVAELSETINRMVAQLSAFSDEVTRVAREVGTDGVLGGQAEVPDASGVWKELTDNVNSMANNLTYQVRNIAEVATAIAEGDLGKKVTVEVKGEMADLKNTVNSMVDRLNSFSAEVTRVARLVGTEGILGGQAEVDDVSGVWKELTDNVNQMASNLTNQVRNIAEVTTAVANGDLSKTITVEVRGEILLLKNTINQMVDRLSAFASEVTRVARDVGTEGVLGGQALVPDVSGIWKELTDNVNQMAGNLTGQVRNIAEVATAVAHGDLSRQITVEVRGEMGDLKHTINTMVDQLNAFASETNRLAREVGVEGTLGGQAQVEGVRGIWRELTDNVNLMASNLTGQVRDIAKVTTAVANGDLTRKSTVDAKGEILDLKNTINTMVDQLGSFADEVTRLARNVGLEGTLGGQADVRGVSGTWRDLTDNVNLMARNLTDQVRNISQVATAIAQGDLEKKITVDAQGEILELKSTINTMVDQLRSFADEVTRVARDVGVEGKLGGQADVKGVAGIWRDLTNNVNLMANNLTNQVRDIAMVTTSVAQGDLTKKVTVEVRGEILDLKNTINTMVDQLGGFASEVTRVARDVGVEGKLGGQAEVRGVAGIWRDLTDNVNLMASNLTNQVRDIAQVTTSVAQGDLTRKVTVEVRGEILELKNTINTMVDQLSSFAEEVTRVARAVGVEGVLGGQAEVRDVSGTWRELTDNVNLMARNLTDQVRGIALVVTAVANGDLQRKLTLEAKGEIAQLAETINDMIVTLSRFAEQVTFVARQVGVEGKLGGQADVPGAAGVWRDLTNNVNELAQNLTNQVRAIGDVATAVTKGDLTRTIAVEARGEVALLKDNINQMIATLADTTRINQEQDWLKTNITKFTRMLQGQRELLSVARQVLSELCPVVNAHHGVFFVKEKHDDDEVLRLFASYGYKARKNLASEFGLGEGIVGQVGFEKTRILMTNVPHDYIQINSGLGEATPLNVVAVPILYESELKGVIELASFERFTDTQLTLMDQLVESLGIVVATIEATMRTESLLQQSQGLTEELQTQQEELQQTNEELEEKAQQLERQKLEVELKNEEVERAKAQMEVKARQLALTSRYKSQFLANMSHELRTPLNSLLILSRQLADNPDGNLSDKQVEYAETIQLSGIDLLSLINEILDLAKIESGTMAVDIESVLLDSLEANLRRDFDQVAAEKGLSFTCIIEGDTPSTLETDAKRVHQILRNLLSNAFKFTEEGGVTMSIALARSGWSFDTHTLNHAEEVIAFAVRDTGIGIAKDQQAIVFESFQQADAGTDRKYGGTGLGLSISRELARLLGGEITLESEEGVGSTFTLYLPRSAPSLGQRRENGDGLLTQDEFDAELEAEAELSVEAEARSPLRLQDDRNLLRPGDRVLLIIDNDHDFVEHLYDLASRRGFRVIVAGDGHEGLLAARKFKPDAIVLDLRLPGVDGWVVLDRLKHDSETRHIPVHVMSVDDEAPRSLRLGAMAFLRKPADADALDEALNEVLAFTDRRTKRLLVVEDDEVQRNAIIDLIGNGDVVTRAVDSGEAALEALKSDTYDCVVLDLSLPKMSGFELIEAVKSNPSLVRVPIVVYTGKELTQEENARLSKLAQTVIVKDAQSPERLLDETALFLHRVEANLAVDKRETLRRLARKDPSLASKHVLVVDDDVRNIFAVTSILEQHDMRVSYAESGQGGIDLLESTPSIDVVLMDIMMPGMDGYEAMQRIRANERFRSLPIIALTAKAMKGDRERCIEAGASDYVTKPVDSDQLVSLLRVWLYR